MTVPFRGFVILPILFYAPYNKCTVAVRHAGILEDYMQLREEFRGTDPMETFGQLSRVMLCDRILKVSSFFYIRPEADLVRPRQSVTQQSANRCNLQLRDYASQFESNALKYNVRSMLVYENVIRVKMFQCTEVNGVQLFVTFGFREGYYFLLTKLRNEPDWNLEFRMIILRSPNLNTVLSLNTAHSRVLLENYFWQFLMSTSGRRNFYRHQHVTPNVMHLRHLSQHEHWYISVCSSIADVLSRNYPHDVLELDIRKMNYVRKIDNRTDRLDLMPVIHSTTNVMARALVLPCAVNREWSNPQFYLLRDPWISTSVFVFIWYGEGLTLFSYVEDVPYIF